MEEKFIRINTAFIPPKEVIEAAQELSVEINKENDSHFILDSQNFYPHITIYPPEYPFGNLEDIINETKKIVEILSNTKLIFKKISAERGFLGVEFENTEEIKNIHRHILSKLNDLRGGYIRTKYINSEEGRFSKEQKNNIEKYGYPELLGLYKPHLTITRLKDYDLAESVAREIKWPIKIFVVDRIGVFKTGMHGTCTELIKEFKLG